MGKLDGCVWAERRVRRGIDRRGNARVLRWIALRGKRAGIAPRSGETTPLASVATGGDSLREPASNHAGPADGGAVLRFPRRG